MHPGEQFLIQWLEETSFYWPEKCYRLDVPVCLSGYVMCGHHDSDNSFDVIQLCQSKWGPTAWVYLRRHPDYSWHLTNRSVFMDAVMFWRANANGNRGFSLTAVNRYLLNIFQDSIFLKSKFKCSGRDMAFSMFPVDVLPNLGFSLAQTGTVGTFSHLLRIGGF